MRHNDCIRFRVSREIRQEIEAAAAKAGEPLSAYMRQAALAHARQRDPETDRLLLAELVELRRTINRAGNNINQIARKLHQGGKLPEDTPEKLEEWLTKVNARVAQALNERRAAL